MEIVLICSPCFFHRHSFADGILRRFRNHLDFKIVLSEHFFPPHPDQRSYQDLASSPLIFPENDLEVVYSRRSGLAEPDEARSKSTMIGRTISRSHIVSQPGGGGIGVVYEADDLKLNRRFTLKFLQGEIENDPAARERFQRQAFAAFALPRESGTSLSASDMRSWTGDLGVAIEAKVRVR
jgi:hypothetical protein